MNKYIIIVGALVLIVVIGIGYNIFFVKEADRPIETGVVRNITITARENQWAFDPDYIEVDQGDRLVITAVNQDDYDHGFSIDAFGVSQRLAAGKTTVIEFVATKAGDFPYYCSVSCGAGMVDGVERGHFDQIGKLRVRAAGSGPQTALPQSAAPPPADNVANPSPQQTTSSLEGADYSRERQLQTIAIANVEARKLGYNPDRLFANYDVGKARWIAYHTSLGNPLKKDPTFAFLKQDNYLAVYYSATTNITSPYLWIFIDSESGQVLHYYEP